MATRVCKKTLVLDSEGITPEGVRFDFANGHSHFVAIKDLPELVKQHALAHGLSQTLGDAYSQSEGNADTAETMFLARWETLKVGWSKGERSGGLADQDLAEALAEVTGKPLEEAQAAVAEGDKAWKEARRKHPMVAALIAERIAKRKAAKAAKAEQSTDDLL